jgi:hypothetical protein
MIIDDDGIPFGWENVTLTEEELDAMCDALDGGDEETAERIVEGAYERLYQRTGGAAIN